EEGKHGKAEHASPGGALQTKGWDENQVGNDIDNRREDKRRKQTERSSGQQGRNLEVFVEAVEQVCQANHRDDAFCIGEGRRGDQAKKRLGKQRNPKEDQHLAIKEVLEYLAIEFLGLLVLRNLIDQDAPDGDERYKVEGVDPLADRITQRVDPDSIQANKE